MKKARKNAVYVPALRRKRKGARKRPANRGGIQAAALIRTLRSEIVFLRREYTFLKGKCERLELAIMERKPGAPADYVARTEAPRPAIESVEAKPKKLLHAQIREEWDKLTLEEQEERIKNGDWEVPTNAVS